MVMLSLLQLMGPTADTEAVRTVAVRAARLQAHRNRKENP
jgi:hypothetical protein